MNIVPSTSDAKQTIRLSWKEEGQGILQHTERFTCPETRLLAAAIIGEKAKQKQALGFYPVTVELNVKLTDYGPDVELRVPA